MNHIFVQDLPICKTVTTQTEFWHYNYDKK